MFKYQTCTWAATMAGIPSTSPMAKSPTVEMSRDEKRNKKITKKWINLIHFQVKECESSISENLKSAEDQTLI